MDPVLRQQTKWTRAELLDAYAVAYRAVVGGEPSRAALAVLWGQATLECGRDGKSCWCHNVGNVRAGENEPHCLLAGAYEFAAVGKVPAGAVIISPPAGAAVPADRPICYLLPAKAQRFRAFDTFAEGCKVKLELLARRWPASIEALRLARDQAAARAFVLGLIVPPAYLTGDSGQYSSGILSLAAECLRTTPEGEWPSVRDTLPAPPDSDGPTWPGTPEGRAKSSDRLRAVDAPIFDGPATPLRAPEAEHTVRLEDIAPKELEGIT